MFSIDFIISFAFMALLFLRQVYILKQPNKLNYAPLILSVGFIATILHLIMYENSDLLVLIRESMLPLLVSMILFFIMNILHQTQQSEFSRNQELSAQMLAAELAELKAFILDLEARMGDAQIEDRKAQEEIVAKFKNDLGALENIQANQMKFVDMFGDVENALGDVKKDHQYFSEVQLPEIDNVIHKHIDILRVAEQEHYNKLKVILEEHEENKLNFSQELGNLQKNIGLIKNSANEIANSIVRQTISQLSELTKSYEVQINLLKSHTEGIQTTLTEDDTILSNIRSQSELLLKQMSLISNKMAEFEQKQAQYKELYSSVAELIQDIETIKSDYVKAQSQLSKISLELLESKDKKVYEMKKNLDELSENLSTKIDESLEKLHEHYHITSKDISQSVQFLAKKAQLKGYTES